ncbi:orotate phosphoribosyltransferase [Patescibacteria group bacterium]|nr:orotate phosphoribosyltransferase [Patescibacteria group bacterium]MBU1672884.1 orotate phosphoribosyltransferase [Patescibacteria group bacterium]MBU1963135.1 orotate phosphoribosyltransferase [Patescibacteria group bacterium]
MDKKELILKLADINAIKFGEFTLKSGIQSPIYIDLRVIVSFPEVLRAVSDEMWKKVEDLDFDMVCGVPYTALPIATAISLDHDIPMVMRRKEVKKYGTKQAIEGIFEPGQTCLIVEDLVTSGSSVFETIEPLEAQDIKVRDVVVLLDREQGGRQNLAEKNYNLHSVITMQELLDTLLEANKIGEAMHDKVMEFIKQSQT